MQDYQQLTYHNLLKIAAAILTPEAEQAAVQPPVDPAIAGGAAMPPQAGGMPPMDPAAAAGAAPAGPMPPDMGEVAAGPRGGEIPPEILQDQLFLQFLMEAMGVTYDPNSGMFVGPDGQPVPVEVITQAYQEFQAAMAQQQQGGMPQGAPPQGAPMPGMEEAQMGMPPQDMAAQMPPEQGAEAAPLPEAQEAAPMEEQADPINEIASAVMSGVEAILQDFTATLEKKMSALLERVEGLSKAVDALQSTTDRRDQEAKDEDAALREEIAADLQPTKVAARQQPAIGNTVNLFELIQGNRR